MCGVTRLDRIKNEYIRGSSSSRNIARKNRLRWFRDVKRKNNENLAKKINEISAEENQRCNRPKKK